MVAVAFVGVFGVLVGNLVLVVASLLGGVFLFSRVRLVRERLLLLPEQVAFNSSLVKGSFTAGEVFSEEVAVVSGADHVFSLSVPVGKLSQSVVSKGGSALSYSFRPELSGSYGFDVAEAMVDEEYGLASGVTGLGFGVELKVYPRVVAAALQALSYLEGRGIQGAGEQPTAVKGRGYEYAESREYVPGDDLKQIDWKATVRLGRHIVKEYYVESSWAVHVLYEADVPDPVSGDELASCFLRSVVSFAERGWVLGLSVLRGGEVVLHHAELHPVVAVSIALRYVLQADVSAARLVYEVLDPVQRSRLRVVMEAASVEGDMPLVREELFGGLYSCVLYLTSLAGDPGSLLEVSYLAVVSGTRLVVVEPCKPWRYGGFEVAYRVWRQGDKVNRSLARMGVDVAVSLEEAFEKLAEQRPLLWA